MSLNELQKASLRQHLHHESQVVDDDGVPIETGGGPHVHAGEDITSGTVADARIAAAITRDAEAAAAYAALAHTHAGSDIASGTVADARIDSALTRDAEAAAAYAALAHTHAGSDIASGTVADARIDSALTRDAEAAAAYAALAHSHAGEDITSGTVADARVDSALTRDSEAAAAYAPLDHAGKLLAVTDYRPGSDSTVGSNNTNTIADVDATNAAVTFTAPASGKVLVRITATLESTGGLTKWGLRESTTTLGEAIAANGANVTDVRLTTTFLVSGISGGSHTYKFAFRTSSGTTFIVGGPSFGSVTIEVWSAP